MSAWWSRGSRRNGAAARLWAGAAVAGLVAGVLVAPPVSAAVRPGPRPAGPRVPAVRSTGTLHLRPVRLPDQAASRAHASGTSWPAAGSAVVTMVAGQPPLLPGAPVPVSSVLQAGGPGGQLAGAAGTPVVAGRYGFGAGPASLAVTVAGHQIASRAGVRGVIFTARAAVGVGGKVRVGISYAGFGQVSGGNYGLGLALEVLPACVLTTPDRPACRAGKPLASVNDAAAKTVSAVLPLPAATAAVAAAGPASLASGAVVLAAAPAYTDGGGAAGTYNATSLRASGTWSAGGSTGSFTYSYPMGVPPSAGGLDPQVGLSYDSGSVDGQTASTQAQASWVGDGWSTPALFIEQSFASCQDNPEGSASPQATADQCYDGPVLTLSLGGSSTPLVCPVPFSYTASSTCTAASDNGEVVTHHVSSGNGQGTKFTDYWTVTTRSGTTYSFGLNHLPGWASGKAATNSVDSVPVFSAHSGDPCYNATFSASFCTMAYRWNLDYVKDVHGNAMAYYYGRDTNAYAQYGTTAAVSYVRDSHLDHVDYGFTDGNAYAGSAPDQVSFTTADRCFTGTCDPLNSTNAANWLDVPYTQDYCAAGSTTCPATAPSFWSTVRLASVAAKQWNGTAYVTADSWALAQHFPATGDGTSPALWLDSVTHTGSDTTAGGSAVTLPAVSFAGTQEANRVNPVNYPALERYRISGITTESGAVVAVAYVLTAPCKAGGPYPSPSANTSSCFPVYWGSFVPGQLGEDWFNKWAVQSVSVQDQSGGSPGTYTSYAYSRPAWHFDDNEVVKTKYRTYGQWRGYGDVIAYNGTGTDPQTESETTYYQGMSADNNTTAVTLTDSQGGGHDDTYQLDGNPLEITAYLYKGGPVDHSAIYSYWVSPAAATRTRTAEGLTALTANYTGQVEAWARQAVTDNSPATWRVTEGDVSYDANLASATAGLPLFTFTHGDLSDPAQQRCTAVTYAPPNTAENLAGLPSETETDALACGGSSPNGSSAPGAGQVNALAAPSGRAQANIVSDTRVFYDNPALAGTWPQPASPGPQAVPVKGEVSVTRTGTGYSGGAFTYQTTSAMMYDSYGRVTASYDPNGGWNGTAYNPSTIAYTMTNGSVTSQKVTNPLGRAETTTVDPLRGAATASTDPNGITTSLHYDGLGRLTGVWKYSRAVTTPANLAYTYQISNSNIPSVVTTQQLNDLLGYVTSTTLYDSLLRVRQTQSPTPQGGALVTDHFYDSRGWEWKTNTGRWDPGSTPGGTILTVADSQVRQQQVTQYDGLGRPVIVTSYDLSAPQSASYATFTGDKVTAVTTGATAATLSGATPVTTTTDASGRTTELDSYTTAPSVTTGTNPGGFPTVTLTGGTSQATNYSYETRGWPSAITDVSTGEQWTRTYNPLGQVVGATDPNAGTSAMSYDAAGNLLTSVNADGKTISYTYDALGRKTGEYDGPNSSSPQIASWTYDNSNNAVPGMPSPIGQLTTATSTYGGNTYTFQQSGFNAAGESLGQKVTLPAAEGGLAGPYSFTHTYTGNMGLPARDSYPASPGGGALPAETVTHGYNATFGLPTVLSSGLATYALNTTWNAFYQMSQAQIGSAAGNAWITSTYDPHTGALTNTNVANTAISATPYDSTTYAYDPSGNITSQTAVRNGTATEQQCYTYDLLQRLSAAWTTDGTRACSAGASTGTGGTVSDGIAGGTYWTSWSYNVLGGQTQQVQHSVTGGTDTVTAYTYNNGNGTGTGQPDTLTSSATTGPGAGTASYAYDPAGNTTARNVPGGNQTLAWYDNGPLKSDTTAAGTTTYVYDPAGNLLLQKDPGQTTLYLPGEQLYLNTATGAVTGTRFLNLPGGGTAVRTGAGTAYSFELSDLHGTSLLTLDSTAANPVWRQQTPYGAPRGTPPGSWPDTNGYLGKPTSANTGLTIIGARNYDPGLGRFISVDPVLQAGDPQTLNGYTYAADNPVTSADPTGLVNLAMSGGGGCSSSIPGCPGYSAPRGSAPSGGGGGCGFLGWNCIKHFGSDVLSGVTRTSAGMLKGAWDTATMPARDLWHCASGQLGSCGDFVGDVTLLRPITMTLTGMASQATSILSDFTHGHPGRALGSLATVIVVAIIAKRVMPAAAAADTTGATAVAPDAAPASRFAVDSSGVATDLGPRVSADRPVVLGESMPGRVIPAAQKFGADRYQPPAFANDAQSLAHNRYWVNEMMNQGRGIIDIGAAPGRANFPGPTSPWFAMELDQVAQRSYPYYMQFPWDH